MNLTIHKTIRIDARNYRLIEERSFLEMQAALRQIDAAGVVGPLQYCDIQAIKTVAHRALTILEERNTA
jgi:hypothetical protein